MPPNNRRDSFCHVVDLSHAQGTIVLRNRRNDNMNADLRDEVLEFRKDHAHNRQRCADGTGFVLLKSHMSVLPKMMELNLIFIHQEWSSPQIHRKRLKKKRICSPTICCRDPIGRSTRCRPRPNCPGASSTSEAAKFVVRNRDAAGASPWLDFGPAVGRIRCLSNPDTRFYSYDYGYEYSIREYR